MSTKITENEFINDDEKDINLEDLLDTKITYKTKNMDIESILNSLKRGDYLLPNYQRMFVWNKAQSSNLILSLIKNIPIPPIYLYYHPFTGKYIILDGQQRITTLFMYYNNIFYKSDKERTRIDFRDISIKLDKIEELKSKIIQNEDIYNKKEIEEKEIIIKKIYKDIENKYNIVRTEFNLTITKDYIKDITFENFDESAKRILRRKDLEAVFVQCDDENPSKIYSDVFKLLNSAGKELSSQEIRNGIFFNNSLYMLIDDLNKNNKIWRKIYGATSSYYKDFEMLLRFLALDYFSIYDKDNYMDKFQIQYQRTFSYSNIIDDFSSEFDLKYIKDMKNFNSENVKLEVFKLNEESKRINKCIRKKSEDQIRKLEMFFSKMEDINEETEVKGRSLLVLEAMFLAFSKLNLLDSNITFKYLESPFIDSKSLNIATSTSNKGEIQKRINKAIEIVRKEYFNEY